MNAMTRKEFLINTAIFTAGSLFKPLYGFGNSHEDQGGPGFLIPVMLNEKIHKLHNNFKVKGQESAPNAAALLDSAIRLMTEAGDQYGVIYNHYQDKVVNPYKGTNILNGLSVDGRHHQDFRRKAKVENINAITAVHTHLSVSEVPSQPIDWSFYRDPHVLQVYEDGRLLVKSLVDNPDKNSYFVPEILSYIICNPIYWCHGLPMEEAQWNPIYDDEAKKIKDFTNKPLTVTGYYTQRYINSNKPCLGGNASPTISKIWWGHDQAVQEYHGLEPILPCGDPAFSCSLGRSAGAINTKPNIKH